MIKLDIICGLCGIHLYSVEDARAHPKLCKRRNNETIMHWEKPQETVISEQEWEKLMSAINQQPKKDEIKIEPSIKNADIKQPDRQVKRYTQSQIKAEGGRRYLKALKTRSKRLLILLVLTVAWIPLSIYMVRGNPTYNEYWTIVKVLIYVAPVALVLANFIIGYIQARNNFYEKVRKHPEILE